ncbi:MAG: lipoprotein-releasing ABC transporter permease subunit [Alphaproteobacteria bacterium]|nr:lipoprotein-releasing ABC transporter permease subunit [Alphaproteobacteria bacterium]
MSFAFERMMAARYLRARRGERFVSIIAAISLVGIALGVATLIIVMSVMNGFRTELLARILGLNGHVAIYAAGEPIRDYMKLTSRIEKLPGVTAALSVVDGQCLLTTDRGGAVGAEVRGLTQSDMAKLAVVSRHIVEGTLANLKGPDAIAIGIGLAQRFGLSVGSRVTLVSPQGMATAFGTVPRIKSYKVVAIFRVGFNEADTSFAYLPLSAAQLFFQSPNAVTQIDVFVHNADAVAVTTAALHRLLAGDHVNLVDWTQSNNSFFNAVEVERNVMFLILTLIIIVAAFNIVSSLFMLVKDKTVDIAILRTMGASSGSVLRIFVIVGSSVGVVGTALGVALGVVFCLNIDTLQHFLEHVTGTTLFNPEVYFLSQLPAELRWQEVLQVSLMALFLSFLATIFPSWRAARTDPVEALRHG